VLAGGTSRRLGGVPKGLEIVGSERVVDHVAKALRQVAPELLLVANDSEASKWLPGVAVVADLHPGAGGMAGVEAALSQGRDALVVAWDMPFVTPRILEVLVQAAMDHDANVVLPESSSPYGFEPFCAYYSIRVRESLARFFDGGGGAARDFLGQVPRVHRIPISAVEKLGDPRRLFFSVNTPDDLERARAMAASTK